MNVNQIYGSLKHSLILKKDIFSINDQQILHKKPVFTNTTIGNSKYAILSSPKVININEIDGFRLINNAGFINIRLTYKYRNSSQLDLVGYIYKYMTSEMMYICKHVTTGEEEELPYSFHYDMDTEYTIREQHSSLAHYPYHLQVIHNYPRFQANEISLELFLEIVKNVAFKNGVLTDPMHEPFFANRI